MKTLVIIFFLAFAKNLTGQSQPAAPCNCTYPLKANTCWTVGAKGGKYCLNKNGNKTYMPKTLKPIVNGQTAKTI